ncbi:MAG TPA: hypothetical protein VHB79_07630 [Polyangiaceae bacterium]|nr:hypothetical protein [Polyangiaceae bacterium]
MLRGICLAFGVGVFLLGCGGDSKQTQTAPPDTTEPDTCDGKCSADELCRHGECHASCSRDRDCGDAQACRSGACYDIACGDEVVEGDEECDNGDRNRDDAACTSACKEATCGDGLVRAGREDCDEGADNSDEGACTSDCHAASCGDGLVWKGHEDCDDGAQNADDGACSTKCTLVEHPVDPTAASTLGWQQGAYTNVTTPVATWKPSMSALAESQELQAFADGECQETNGKPVAVPSLGTSSLPVPVAGDGSYSFQIVTHNSDGTESLSACSPTITVDTVAPEPATDLAFVETSPHDSLTVHGTWTLSPSVDIGTQSIQLYGGGTCSIKSGDPVDVRSATAEQAPIVTPTPASYSFKVITTDKAGNSAESACSGAIQTAGGKPYTAKFNGDLPQSVVQARLDPNSASTLYVTLASGEIHKSTNAGATWTLQCVSSNIRSYGSSYGHIVVSPDGTAYATGHTQFARVEANGGAECPVAISGSAAWASYYHSNRLAIDSTGKIYTWAFTSPAGLVSSINKGDTYTAINTTASLFNSMEVDPFDDKHLVVVFGSHSTDPLGIYHSIDAGKNWIQTDATFENYQDGIRFNRAAKGWIYLGSGHYSKDGGTTWETPDTRFDSLEIDATGAGYRLTASGPDTLLQRAPDMTNPVWSTVYTFSGGQPNLGVSMVSVVGSNIAVVLEGNLFVSTNAGKAFSPVKLVVKNGMLTASSIVGRGSLVYAAAAGRIFKSTNAAQSWTLAYAPAKPLDADTELHLNPGTLDQLVARVESWNSSYEDRVDVTLDGGATWTSGSDCCYSWAGVLALGPADPSRLYYFGFHPRYSSNGGLSFMEAPASGQLVWEPWPAAFVSPANSNQALYGDDSGRLFQYDFSAKSDSNVTARLPFAAPAGIDMIKVGNSWQVRVISSTGQIAVSNDGGATFSAIAGTGGLPAAARRIFVSHPDLPNLIATAPLLGGTVAYSPTFGASWVQTTLDNCDIRSRALTDGQLIMACDNQPALALAAP